MLRPLDALASLLFVAFLCVPGASLAIYGYSQWAENPPTWRTTSIDRLFAFDSAYRKDIVKSVLINTPVGIEAIAARSYTDYRIFGSVNNPQVISGRDGWLFFKRALAEGRCQNPNHAKLALNRVEAMRVLAEGAGIELKFSVSPDKSVVYPEQFNVQTRAYAGCKTQSAKAWRDLANKTHSNVIDHLAALRGTNPDQKLYFATDTHWNNLGSALAIRQLAVSFGFPDPGLPDTTSFVTRKIKTDLIQMLRLDDQEEDRVYLQFWNQQLKAAVGAGLPEPTVVLLDSFYGKIRTGLMMLFPNASMTHVDGANVGELIENGPKRILVNSVERGFFTRVISTSLSWSSEFGRSLVMVNRRATSCTHAAIDDADIKVYRVDRNGSTWQAQEDPQIFLKLPQQDVDVCIRLRFRSDDGSVPQIFLPVERSGEPLYQPGMSIEFWQQKQPIRDIAFILPKSYAGTTLRLDLVAGPAQISSLSIEVGRPLVSRNDGGQISHRQQSRD